MASRVEDDGEESEHHQSLLTGEQLEEYCLQHGLCPLCARTKTHERIGPFRIKLAGSGNKSKGSSQQQQWKPISISWDDAMKKEKEEEKKDEKGGKKKKRGLFGKGKGKGSDSEQAEENGEGSANPTEPDNPDNDYWMVYRGFCLRPGCFTLDQAKRLRGEIGPYMTPTEPNDEKYGYYCFQNSEEDMAKFKKDKNGGDQIQAAGSDDSKKKNKFLFGGGKIKRNKKSEGRSGRGRRASKVAVQRQHWKDIAAFDSAMTGFSYPSSAGKSSSMKGSSRGQRTATTASESSRNRPPSSLASIDDDDRSVSTASVASRKHVTGKIRRRGQYGGDESVGTDMSDDMSVGSMGSYASIGSAMTSDSRVRRSLKELLKDQSQEQAKQNHFQTLLLDLSHTRLHHVHVLELVQALDVATLLQTLILENCKLNDNELEVIGKGLMRDTGSGNSSRPPVALVRLSLRSNKIGNRGVVGLCPFFKVTTTLRELDVSKNQIGSRGASSILHAFRDNPASSENNQEELSIQMINFAHNEIWDVDDGSFFSTNESLRLFNLEGNFIHDEGVHAIADGLLSNTKSQLTELYLGWNGIGDEGCLHLSRMIEAKNTLEKLGLGENDITSVGARGLLNSLAQNKSLNEITGLYHNQIDRKFVIEAISRILYSHMDVVSKAAEAERRTQYEMDKRASMTATDTLVEPLGSTLPIPDEVSEGSLDWADRLYMDETEFVEQSGVPLGELSMNDPPSPAPNNSNDDEMDHKEETPSKAATEPKAVGVARYAEMPPICVAADRLAVVQSAPLAYLPRGTTNRVPVPLHDFDLELAIIKSAVEGSARLDAKIDTEVLPATIEDFSSLLKSGRTRVLHYTGYGHPTHVLAFEDEDGYIDDTFELDSLRGLVQAANPPLELVVVNSFHSGRIGKAFVDAGVPHVVCCHHPEIFRDKAANSFLKNFYRALSTNKSLKQAFDHAQESVRVEEITKDVKRYVLLPRKADDDSYHDVPIFFRKEVPENSLDEFSENLLLDEARKTLPKLPKYFIGREVDMCRVLDSVRVEKIVRIGGVRGMGKSSLAAAVCRYVQKRPKAFEYDDVFWLPAARGVVPEEDTLFADLVLYTNLMMNADHDVSSDMDALECRERIEIELEGRRCLIAIDSRKFENTNSAESLENFVSGLMNNTELDVKIILINSNSEEEDATINLGPIEFKSTALLFGAISRFITANGCPAAQSPDEYADLVVPPSVANAQKRKDTVSVRRDRLMNVMGDGIPLEVIRAGKTMQANVFIRLIGLANTPEVQIDSIESLEAAIAKWKGRMEYNIENKNCFRAMDLQQVLKELESQRSKFPSIEDMVAKEKELHRKHTLCFKTRRYEEGNRIKREILELKRQIMRQKRAISTRKAPRYSVLTQSQSDKIADIKAQMDQIMKLANSSFSSLTDLQQAQDKTEAVFKLGSAYHRCDLRIYPGNVEHFDPGNDLGASVCWTNESCELGLDDQGRSLLAAGGQNLDEDIQSLPGIAETPWGITKCGTGNAVIVGPGNYDDLQVHCVILAVGPISPQRDEMLEESDHDALHYITVMMRSCIRSSFILAKHSQVQSIAVPTLTTKLGGPTYETTLMTNLKLLIDEAKFSDLNTLHIVASSEEESSKLIEMALNFGLTMAS
jgi:O-acetyl-ADP-ribose deacetylase (regulator of RNase III)